METNIKIIFDEEIETYSIYVNGECLMECLGEEEINQMTLVEIWKAYCEAIRENLT